VISAVKSVAILKSCIDQNKDLVDDYVPFIANQAKVHSYVSVNVETLVRDFAHDYGLTVPYHPMISILNRCIQKQIVEHKGAEYRFNSKRVAESSFSSEAARVEAQIDAFLDAFRRFADEKFGKSYTLDQSNAIIISFLKAYDAEIILSNSHVSALPETAIASQDEYVFNKYVLHLHSEDPKSYQVLVELAVGYLYASSVLFTELKKPKSGVRNLQLIFDTRLLLRLVGLEGEEIAAVYRKLLSDLKEDGGRLKVFKHTIEEMNGILDDCIQWVQNPKYESRYAGPALRHFVENKYSMSDVVLFKANLETQLGNFGIRSMDGGFGVGLVKDQVDEQQLYDIIVQEYSRHNDYFRECSKREVLYRDVKSLSAVARLRKGALPKSLKRAGVVFVTTNTALARAASKFFDCQGGRDHACECVTDLYLGTVTWLNAPSVIQDLQYRRILADTVAALRPDAELVERYRSELDKLKNQKEISEREYYFLRSHPRPLSRLEDKTFGDSDAFYDKLPEEILEEFRAEMKAEFQKEADAIASQKESKIAELASTLESTKRESECYREKLAQTNSRIEHMSSFLTWTIGVVVSLALAVLLVVAVIPIGSLFWQLVIGIPLALISALNLILGLTVRQFYRPVRDWIAGRLRRVFGLG